MDLPESAENLERLRKELCDVPLEILPIAAGTGECGEAKTKLRAMVERVEAASRYR